jgi:Ca2+-transporting ATPase
MFPDATLTAALPHDLEDTPLQLMLIDLADATTKTGRIAGGLLFVALLIPFFFELGTNNVPRYFDVSSLLSNY